MDRGQSQGKRKRAEEESIEGASTSSSISPESIDACNGQYDVFLSFRGSDTRKAFTDHLYHSLIKAGMVPIYVFKDDKSIPIGEEFGSQILDAITRSKISIPIISENYASSKWCLRELTHIMDCKKRTSHMVLPIFYKVEPSDVRYLKGSFGEAFHSHKNRFDKEDIQEVQRALREVSDLHGWESEKFANGHEGELVEKVVQNILSKLRQDFRLDITKHLVGIEDHVNKIRKWVDTPASVARMIGIYGMGGIGKTTLAKVIYNELSHDFVHRSFLADIRETASCNNMPYLQKQLIKDVLQIEYQVGNVDDGISLIKLRFKGKKVLILLDDIDDKNQLDALARECDWFMPGSMIIVTTRNEAVLDQSEFEVVYKYELNELDEERALLLFNRHAFRKDHSPSDFKGISCDITSIMGGLPLALQVVGSYLYKKTKLDVWEDVRKQLKNQPHRDVQKMLQISYDALQNEHKQIFLDIACFLIGKNSKFAMYMWEDCGLYPSQGIEELKLRCLIKIGYFGEFEMHDQLRDLGRSILCQGQPLEKRNLPWDEDYEGVSRVLIQIEQKLKSLKNLQRRPWFHDFLGAGSSGHSKQLLSEVRWLEWNVDASLSTINLYLPKLSVLQLWHNEEDWEGCDNKITENWKGWSSFMELKGLKVLTLTNCHNLRRTPDLSTFTKLKILHLLNCHGLERLDPSIGGLASLVTLALVSCESLEKLPEEVGELKNLEELLLWHSGIREIPPSIASLTKLKELCAADCKSLREIPSSIGDLQNLQRLYLCFSAIEKLPSEIGNLPSLEDLDIRFTLISGLPESVRNLSSLQFLKLEGCEELRSLPELPSSLPHLDLSGHKVLRSLARLPSSLQSLDLRWCVELQSLPELPSSLQSLDLSKCVKLRSLPELPSSLQSLYLWDCEELRSLPKLPSSLQYLDLGGCKELRSLPELASSLQCLDLGGCKELRSLPELPSSLQYLYLGCCEKHWSLPELPSSLKSFSPFYGGEKILLPELPSFLYRLNYYRWARSPELPPFLRA
ncbi:hypothetical protein ACJRO7_011080 [Eucalyptus globulus]|uniref:TIR domain-containing protein n=1 Tax=Eucalyptus globulus TaxID=34317 RepID=A0ABD3LE10_EUCGL